MRMASPDASAGGLFESGTSTISQSMALERFVPLDSKTGIYVPKLNEAIIDGVLRRGHMLMLTGPPKAGKSWAMIQLAYAIAKGSCWMDYECKSGKVVYVDTEMDPSSLYNRFDKVRDAMGFTDSDGNIYVLPLRGKSDNLIAVVDMIVDAFGNDMPALVVIDSIYTLEAGDENSNGEMRDTLREIARLTSNGTAVAFAHHHAKGAAGARNVIDRGAGAGAFGRFVDAHIDLNPISLGAEDKETFETLYGETAVPMRMAFVLREFSDKPPREVVFDFPLLQEVKYMDLSKAPEEGTAEAARQKGAESTKRKAKAKWEEKDRAIGRAVNDCISDGIRPTRDNVLERIIWEKEVTKDQLKRWTTDSGAPNGKWRCTRGTNELYCIDPSWAAET